MRILFRSFGQIILGPMRRTLCAVRNTARTCLFFVFFSGGNARVLALPVTFLNAFVERKDENVLRCPPFRFETPQMNPDSGVARGSDIP